MRNWLILQTILFESASLYLLSAEQLSLLGWISYASSHSIAAISFTALFWLILPMRYKTPLYASMGFIFVIAISMPLVGMLGLTLIFLVALYLPSKQDDQLWQRSEIVELPQHVESIEASQFGSAALKDILLFNPSDERRLIAVNACRFLPEKVAMPLLKIALTDKVDDVRLLAYAAIEKMEFSINQKIDALTKKLKQKESAEAHYQIASLYWELCYLEIAEGPLQLHYLEQAKHYLQRSLDLKPSAQTKLKLGRVLLQLQEFDQAKVYLEQAHASGLLATQVVPYLAEVAFAQGEYYKTAELLKSLPESSNIALSQLKEYWLREAH
ncbi:tetratricopeptide repeat protein [Paraferrimonas sedimenticola]|uniref:Pellicle/biofilm biosynthesis protein PelE n=1 Tax=Paraferrimonas sedimenticola TaxID=375674 RepID=A0AA37W0Z0_9GAMM|nr:hypothetical protein [Paraferrimonas sedimenticola]GLP96343.1 pellicle/biofilm biosynthesis protein PelE [Paraferrimonas sedimenticola]